MSWGGSNCAPRGALKRREFILSQAWGLEAGDGGGGRVGSS